MKNKKLKNKDFFDVEQNPVITFKSTKFVRAGHDTYEVDGDFTVRGVSNPEKLKLIVSAKGTVQPRSRGTWSSTVKTTGWTRASRSSRSPTTSRWIST